MIGMDTEIITRIWIEIEGKEDVLLVGKKAIKLEIADRRDSPMGEEIEDLNTEADPDRLVTQETAEEEEMAEGEEIEAMMTPEVEEGIEMITEDTTLPDPTVEVTRAMTVEEMESKKKEITGIKITAEIEIQDHTPNIVKMREGLKIKDIAVRRIN